MFKKIYLEITNRCNLACSFCQESRRARASMTPAFFADILRQIRPYTAHLSLHVLGEPLLHPHLGELLDHCHQQGLRVNITTNGTLLPQHHDLLLTRPALRQINISLHCQETIADGPGREAYLTGVLAFIRAATSRTPLIINLRLWNSDGSSLNEAILTRLASCFGIASGLAGTLTPGQGIPLAPRVFLSIARRFVWPHAPAPDLGDHGFCHGLRTHVAILVDGTVVPCCLDAEADAPLGNIRQQPFAAIIAGERANRIRKGFGMRRVTEPLCRRCTFRLPFSRKMAAPPVYAPGK